ncbi:MAG: ABC transporter ATP-binding protein [Fuerstiella sp.]
MNKNQTSSLLQVSDFQKAYEGVPAVKGINFQVDAGQILGVIGPNGAGKTTTMRALSALISPTAGALHVAGFDVEKSPVDVKRRLAYVPDDPKLFPHLTVEEHLAFTAAAFRVNDADSKAVALLEDFELAEKRKVAAKDLSRGMRQKLAICCAYLYDPAALLFDEPLTGLDPMGIRMLKQSIVDRAANGAAVMVSSHLLAMVEDICTHILLISKGEQQFFGTVAELKTQFSQQGQAATLEQIFFMATDKQASNAKEHALV